ncbi:MAG: right-handed parallel beta-helix repeat-containing protein [Candidatus Bipolaricaulota bacterium]|nr:right-handed parallel beta-helix repeat-containing protein [Candidatus Bipolaricaulota bacterium]MDW8110998.1 right-handed parallel beta-helix repeat-containing protein [Candidatus Bipolaricaulota bacterium]MDW8329001.1 right-handed parallel beta-helix repeat-containing protein [Candidatus Bipolaricaulota bacterium]
MSAKHQESKREKRNLRRWGWLGAGVIIVVVLGIAGAFWATQQIGERRVTVCRVGCDFAKISEAIAALPPHGTIVLRPGVYAESVLIEKALSLLGDEKTTIEGEITVRNAQNVTLAQITLKGALRIQASKSVRVERVGVLESAGDGVTISHSTDVSLSESTVTGHQGDGVAVVSFSQVELRQNAIGNNGGCGIRSDDGSRVTGEGNRSGGALVPQDFKTIQEAINAWRSEWGPNVGGNLCGPRLAPALLTGTGEIFVGPGIYRERLTIRDKTIYLRGAGIDETILDGSGFADADGITLRGKAQLTLESFTVRNFGDDGLDAEGEIELAILKSAFIANKSTGLEIAHNKVRLRLKQSIVRDNGNYGLWVLGVENLVECSGNTISNNGTNYGGLRPDVATSVESKCQGEL